MADVDAPVYSTMFAKVEGALRYGAASVGSDGQFGVVETNLVISQTTAIPNLIQGAHHRVEYAGVGGFSGGGHIVTARGELVMNAAAETLGIGVGLEGQIRNLAGTITECGGAVLALSTNAAGQTITQFKGASADIQSNAGTVTTYAGYEARCTGNAAGTVTAMIGLVVIAPTAGTSVNYIGVQVLNNTVSTGAIVAMQSTVAAAGSGTTRRGLQFTGDAINYLAGVVRIGGTDADKGAQLGVSGAIAITDGMAAPTATAGFAKIFVDTADGDLKVIFADGFVRVIGADS